MDPLTELLTGLGLHYGLVLVGCAELIAALFLLGWRPRERRGRERLTAVSSVDRLMLSELYRQEEQVCLVLRRSDRMPLQAIGNLEGLLGATLDRLRETMDALFSGLDRPVDGADFWRKYANWGGLRDLCREMKMSSGQWLRLTVRRTADGMEDLLIFRRITQERQRDEEYEARLRQAEEASQFKTSFLFRVSHEIRTPMNGITGTFLNRKLTAGNHTAVVGAGGSSTPSVRSSSTTVNGKADYNGGGVSSLDGLTHTALNGGTVATRRTGVSGASGGGGGYRYVYSSSSETGPGGSGGGVSTIPFGSSYFEPHCSGGSGGNKGDEDSSDDTTSWTYGAAGGVNGADGATSPSSQDPTTASIYGSGGRGGHVRFPDSKSESVMGGAGSPGIQGVIYIRIPI